MVNTRPILVSITLINRLQNFQLNVTFRGVIRTKIKKTNEILWRNQHFRVPKPLTFKTGQLQNLSCKNEFYLQENEETQKHLISYQQLRT